MKPQPAVLKMVEALFVDRDEELGYAENNLWPADAQKRIYYVTGQSAIGKTWLLYRYYLDCSQRGYRCVWIDFSRGPFTDYLAILRDIQVTLEQTFERFQKRTEENLRIYLPHIQTGAGDAGEAVAVESEARLKGVSIGQAAGRDINTFYIQIKDLEILQQYPALTLLTEAFQDDLVDFLGEQEAVFLFDDIGDSADGSVTYLDSRTRQWLIEEFILPLHERLPRVRFVLTQTGGTGPDSLLFYAQKHTLTEFRGDQAALFAIYRAYLDKRGYPASQVNDETLQKLHEAVQGQPGKLFAIAGNP